MLTRAASAFCCIAALPILAALPTSQAGAEEGASADWSGFYVGFQAGYLFGQSHHTFSNGAPSDDSDPNGVVGGLHAGYNFEFDSIVVGPEADFEGTSASGHFDNTSGITSSGSADLRWQSSLRGRVGYAIDSFLPYVTAGIAFGDYEFGGGPTGGPCCGYSDTLTGWTAGAGVEYLMDRVSLRLEYRYTDYGKASDGLAPAFPGVSMPVDNQTHAIRMGVSLHF
jgi:outer membrane immunogenic protein